MHSQIVWSDQETKQTYRMESGNVKDLFVIWLLQSPDHRHSQTPSKTYLFRQFIHNLLTLSMHVETAGHRRVRFTLILRALQMFYFYYAPTSVEWAL